MKRIFIALMLFAPLMQSCNKEDEIRLLRVKPTDFLESNKFNQLVIELKYVDGQEPDTKSLENLKGFLSQRLNKPGGIEIRTDRISSSGQYSYSTDDLEAIEKDTRTEFPNGRTLTAYVLYLDKNYAGDKEDQKVLGLAYGTTSVAIFKETIEQYTGGLTQPSQTLVETTVLEHEFGHLLGLVNFGTKTTSDHEDTSHPGHCDNPDCLMYYAVETSDVISNLFDSGKVPELNEQCLNDLRANGGK